MRRVLIEGATARISRCSPSLPLSDLVEVRAGRAGGARVGQRVAAPQPWRP